MKKFIVAVAMVVGVIFTQASVAQEGQQLSPAEQAENQAIIETARNLASYAEARGDALALVVAARMLTEVPGRVLAEGEQGDSGAMIDITGMLDRAEQLANGDEFITAQIAEVRQAAEEASRAICYWEYYCAYGWCQYYYICF